MKIILLLLPIFLAFPAPRVQWANTGRTAVRVNLEIQGQDFEQCLNSGLEVRYRYKLTLCRRRAAWFDSCESQRMDVQSLSFDPVSEMYRITADRIGDEHTPVSTTVTSQDEAWSTLATLESVPLDFLGLPPLSSRNSSRYYLAVRVLADCKGDYNLTLERISRILSLGFIRLAENDTGTVNFDLGNLANSASTSK